MTDKTLTIKGIDYKYPVLEGDKAIVAIAFLANGNYAPLAQSEIDLVDNESCLCIVDLNGKPTAGFGAKALDGLPSKDGAAPKNTTTRGALNDKAKAKAVKAAKTETGADLLREAEKRAKAKARAASKGAGALAKAAKTGKPAKKPTTKAQTKKAAPKKRDDGPTASSIILDHLNKAKGTTRNEIYAALKKAFPKKSEVALKNTMGSLMHTLPIRHKLRIKKVKIEGGTRKDGRWLYKKM